MPTPRQLWIWWTIATSLSWMVSWGVCFAGLSEIDPGAPEAIGLAVAIGFLLSQVSGSALQGVILRRQLPVLDLWLWMSLIGPLSGLALGLPVLVALMGTIHPLLAIGCSLLGYGLVVGLGQWWVLRSWLDRSLAWVLVQGISLGVGLFLCLWILAVGIQDLQISPVTMGLIGGGLGGGLTGALTGIGLTWLLRHPLRSPLEGPIARQIFSPQNLVLNLIALGIALGWLVWIESLPFRINLTTSPLSAILFLGLYYYLAIAVHEAGHGLAARVLGFHLDFLVVGPLQLLNRNHSLQLQINRSLMVAGGLTSVLPTRLQGIRWQLISMIAGGPLASLGLAVAGMALAGFPLLTASHVSLSLVLVFSGISLMMGVVNALPLQVGYFQTDGARIWMLLRDQIQGKRTCAIFALGGLSRIGRRPREWDTDWIEQAMALPDGSYDHHSGIFLAYYWALDQGAVEWAGQLLDEGLRSRRVWPDKFVGRLLLEAAYFEAFHRRRPQIAQDLLAQVGERFMIEPYTERRVEAALQWAQDRKDQAVRLAQTGLREVQRDLNEGIPQAEQEWLQQIIQASRDALPPAAILPG